MVILIPYQLSSQEKNNINNNNKNNNEGSKVISWIWIRQIFFRLDFSIICIV